MQVLANTRALWRTFPNVCEAILAEVEPPEAAQVAQCDWQGACDVVATQVQILQG